MRIIFRKEFKVILLLFLLSFVLLFSSGCSEKKIEEPIPEEKPKVEEKMVELTLEELKEFNGKEGKRAYVAVDGIIYDMTDSSLWKDGEHNNFSAGNDLTEEIKNISPHGVSTLERVPIVGKIVEK